MVLTDFRFSASGFWCVQAPALVTASNASECLVDAHDTFLFDMDGVLFVGMRMIARSNEAVRRLMALGKRVVFITNNTTKGRKASPFQNRGITVVEHWVVSNSVICPLGPLTG